MKYVCKNCKMLITEINEDLSKWKDIVFMYWKTQQSKDINFPQIGP